MANGFSEKGNPLCQASSNGFSEKGNPLCQASSGCDGINDNPIHQEDLVLIRRLRNQEQLQQQYFPIRSGVVREDSETIQPQSLVPQLPSQLICLVCLERLRTCVFIDCGHLLVCMNCQQFYRHCPVCGERINDFIKISLSSRFG